ncbi:MULTISPECIES: hypothetical protein [Sphingobacterium]|uniref:Iron complex transport system substrate-binding protein n=1 Tax=Sphingobacterium cellulitidis TaxID=1768011 RepID=A0A8H9KXL8_9SPHI|nr:MULTISPECIES: hypothetical protein [Sphingobacterium]MBA8988704.1 iron complex transport system substrate-binding protein [Sphingobacterium soli]OYD43257.1 hypothetical protein CHT99_05440 [Sphingobacterium cellulitidis]OYD47404.1 hypothetical protein CHU00_00550 [Sphingobacterium cellulitidis]WFB62653.1 hypothetical protein PZ892_13320 [Sphingobacterium sp. WM]GGE35487.1 hypothetical protein GCM10011516_36340 [Sphingobacterium soli]
MIQLKHYSAISNDLQKSNPEKFELLEEELNIIIHKLKFIAIENRPMVEIIDLSTPANDPTYIEELSEIAGAQNNPLVKEAENIEILIFINDNPAFLGKLPELLNNQYSDYKAVKNNNVFIIQKADFAKNKENYLVDTEIFAEIIQSKYFVYGHEGQYWVKFDL